MTNWFGNLDELRHKTEVLEQHCEAEGRDPSTILRTVMAPFVLVRDEREAQPTLDRLTPERRAASAAMTPAQAADGLRPYVDAGFMGFIFRNPTLKTPESLGLAGELIALLS